MANARKSIQLLAASLGAIVLNIVLAFVVAALIPIPIGSDRGPLPFPRTDVFTKQQLDTAEKAMKERVKKDTEEIQGETFADRLSAVKRHAAFISWVPWFLLPFFLPVKRFGSPAWYLLYLLVPPIVLVPTDAVWLFEIPLFALALVSGIALSKQILERSKNEQ